MSSRARSTRQPAPSPARRLPGVLGLLLVVVLVATACGPQTFVWGDNGSFALGDGTTTDRSAPVSIDVDRVGPTVTSFAAAVVFLGSEGEQAQDRVAAGVRDA